MFDGFGPLNLISLAIPAPASLMAVVRQDPALATRTSNLGPRNFANHTSDASGLHKARARRV